MLPAFEITRERKIILIGGAVLLLLAAIYRFYPLIGPIFSGSDEIRMKQKIISRYQNVVARADRVDADHARIRRMLSRSEAGRLAGATESLAAVEIQNIINTFATANNINIDTMQVMKTREVEGIDYAMIPVRFAFGSDILQLKEILHRMETHDKMLIISEINTGVGMRTRSRDIGSTITVEGVMKKKGATG
jgi:type II secretory pathway component PulM